MSTYYQKSIARHVPVKKKISINKLQSILKLRGTHKLNSKFLNILNLADNYKRKNAEIV